MKFLSRKLLPTLLVVCANSSFAGNMTISGDLLVEGKSDFKGALISRAEDSRNDLKYFSWVVRDNGPSHTNGNTPDNSVVYIDFGDHRFWGAMTVTITGNYAYTPNHGILRKHFPMSRSNGSTSVHSDGRVDLALGPVASNYRIGRPTSVGGTLRVPIHVVNNRANSIHIRVEGHVASDGSSHELDPGTDITLTSWSTTTEDYESQGVVFVGQTAIVNSYFRADNDAVFNGTTTVSGPIFITQVQGDIPMGAFTTGL